MSDHDDAPGTEPVEEGGRAGGAAADATSSPPGEPGAGRGDAAGFGEASSSEAAAELRRALDEREDRYLRLAADFENFKRRKAQEMADRSRYASEDAARALLPVLDNLRRAVDNASEEADRGLLDGVRMTIRQFEEALSGLGITPIAAAGEPFDPAVHQAVLAEPSAGVDRETVLDELQRGYRLHDRVLRPALVRVAHPDPGADGAAAAGG